MTVSSGGAATLKVAGGSLVFLNPTAQDCGGATTTNTDTITVLGTAGTTESLTLDESGGGFSPGAAVEAAPARSSEIEIAVRLGDASDHLTILGTRRDDTISAGTTGVALNGDNDSDVSFDVLPAAIEIRGNGGVNTIGGRGGDGAGTLFPGRLVLYAGDLGDTLRGGLGDDEIYGGAGADTLEGREANDTARRERRQRQPRRRRRRRHDDRRRRFRLVRRLRRKRHDPRRRRRSRHPISGGAGIDTAYYDAGLDANPGAVENKIPA